MGKWAVVIPSNRPDQLDEWRRAWGEAFDDAGATIYVVEDKDPWPGIPDFIPKGTDGIRSWGFYQAWRDGHDFILSMDDDVRPYNSKIDPAWLLQAYEIEFRRPRPVSPYFSVGSLSGTEFEMRGFPAQGRGRPVGIQYGVWNHIPDLDGETQLAHPDARSSFDLSVIPVPKGAALTCCAMNFAFRREYAPWCWQLPMFESRYNRWHDIWSGLAQKRLCDLNDVAMVVNGRAAVKHIRASDPVRNAAIEAPGRVPNERLWRWLQNCTDGNPVVVFTALIMEIGKTDPEWANRAYRARDAWFDLFKET